MIAWGTLYYSIAILVAPMASTLGFDRTFIFLSFTVSLLVSGLIAPTVGAAIDANGGRYIMAAGSIVAAIALSILANSAGPIMFLLGWMLAGLAMGLTLYEAAFASMIHLGKTSHRRAVAAITIIAGFASTAFWPLTNWLVPVIGWRHTLLAFAGLHLFVALPVHLSIPLPSSARPAVAAIPKPPHGGPKLMPIGRWLATAIALAAFSFSVVSAHVVLILTDMDIADEHIIAVAALMGPAQVAGRIFELSFSNRISIMVSGAFAFFLLFLSMVCLWTANGHVSLAFAFIMLHGMSKGMFTVVRGTLPVEISRGSLYGRTLGHLSRPSSIAKALAPGVFALVLAAGFSTPSGILLLVTLAGLALTCYVHAVGMLHRERRRPCAVQRLL